MQTIFSPLEVVVPVIKLITVSIDISGVPRQFLLIKQNILCPILFRLDVPGGKCETCISGFVTVANTCNCFFRSLSLEPLPPPLSLFIYSRPACGQVLTPSVCRHLRMLATANSAVSREIPGLTNPSFLLTPYMPYGATFPGSLGGKS